MSTQGWQLMNAGTMSTLGIVKAETPKGAVQEWRKQKGHESPLFDQYYHIKEVMQGFRVIIGTAEEAKA